MFLNWFKVNFLDEKRDIVEYSKPQTWTGVIYKISRHALNSEIVNNVPALKFAGIYFLVKNNNISKKIYIGQADVRNNNNGILARVLSHLKEEKTKDFDYVYILTNINNWLSATELKYLEHSFINIVKNNNNKQFELLNDNAGTKGNISVDAEKDWNIFIQNSIIILQEVGFDAFSNNLEAYKDNNEAKTNNEFQYFKLSKKDRVSKIITTAYCKKEGEKFIVLANSQIRGNESEHPYFTKLLANIKQRRDDLFKQGKIKDNILLEDQAFSSASYASAFVLGRSSNGKIEWEQCDSFPDFVNNSENNDNSNTTNTYTLTKNRRNDKSQKITAFCKKVSDNIFIVTKGSDIEMIEASHFKHRFKSIHELRKKLIKNGAISNYKLYKDMQFSSLSYASSFVLGRSSSGNIDWKKK
ncbi:DUF4357 domain-containing protein [Mycoplasmopsis bovis]|uniref:DUF4357 domain-containing protein n=1 Tax=Mycoplasmopsis bovis TaxID=28903 RepID=UPI0027A12F82